MSPVELAISVLLNMGIAWLLILDAVRSWDIQPTLIYTETWLNAHFGGKALSTQLAVGDIGLLLSVALINWGLSASVYQMDFFFPYEAVQYFQLSLVIIIVLIALSLLPLKLFEILNSRK